MRTPAVDTSLSHGVPPGDSGAAKPPRLSLGLPVYNGSRFLNECIESILAQTYTDFELIVCDNASTDDTVAIVERWAAKDSRISLHRSPVNRGAAPNFNWCFELARGELFKWCAADDLMEPEFLERCIAALDADPGAVLAYPGTVDIDENGNLLGELYDHSDELEGHSERPHRRFHHLILLMHQCTSVFGVIRSSALRESTLIGRYVGSDHVLLAELALMGRSVRIKENLLKHREHRGRSVRDGLADMRKRAVWFDTRARGRVFPFWRFLREYARAALTVGRMPAGDRVRCCLEVIRWVRWGYGRELINDLKYHFLPNRQPSAGNP